MSGPLVWMLLLLGYGVLPAIGIWFIYESVRPIFR